MFALAVVWFGVWFSRQAGSGERRTRVDGKGAHRSVPEPASRVWRSGDSGRGKPKLTPVDDAGIVTVREKLKALEAKRTVFCREVVQNGEMLQNFIVAAPSPEEAEEMMALLSRVKGLTKDRDLKVISWKERLMEEFFWPEKFTECILTTNHDATTKRWRYTMLGVTEGNMLMRNGNAPMPADGKVHIIRSEWVPDEDGWRFSHLFSKDADAEE